MITDPEQAKARLTEREYQYWLAARDGDVDALEEFGDDANLLAMSVQAKLSQQEDEPKKVAAPVKQEPKRALDALDKLPAHKPFDKNDLTTGDKVMLKATGTIHKVVGMDRSSTPAKVKIDIAGRMTVFPRELVAKIMPDRAKVNPNRLDLIREQKALARPTNLWDSDQDD